MGGNFEVALLNLQHPPIASSGMPNFAYRLSSRIKVVILVHMVLQGLGRSKGRVFATRESASEQSNMGHFMLQTKLFGLKTQCGPGARIESAGKRGGSKLALEQFQFFGGNSWVVVLTE
jgi:hypothetical protein